jgi:predicted O-methyltransferase YrrM
MLSKLRTRLIHFLISSKAGRWPLIPYRLKDAIGRYWPSLKHIPLWLLKSSEISNFTYDTTDESKQCLASTVSMITGCKPEQVLNYVAELDNDTELKEYVTERMLREHDFTCDLRSKPGKRIAYYVLVRALKPNVVVEVGVDKGFGTCIIAAALKRNAIEGTSGKVYGVDRNPNAGYLFRFPYDRYGSLVVSDGTAFADVVSEHIDLLINDAIGEADHEEQYLELVKNKLSGGAVIVSVWHTGSLMRFAWSTARQYIVFRETPKDHWYPGATIGLAFRL